MLRKKVKQFATEKRFRPALKLLSRILHIVGLCWIVSFPYMAREVFTSENALRGDRIKTELDNAAELEAAYAKLRRELEPLDALAGKQKADRMK